MKKIMITVAIACAAVCSQAASMKWGSSGMKNPGSTANLSGATAQLFVLTATEYSTLQTTVAGLTVDQTQQAIYKAYSTATATVTSTAWTKGSTIISDPNTYGTGDTAYAVVLYTKTVDEKEYYIANMGSWTFESDSTKTQLSMGTKLNGSGDTLAWQSVPEPTSGLLLLIGMGALALRRKRA